MQFYFKIVLLQLFLLLSYLTFAQNRWTNTMLEKANTAGSNSYLNDEEKAIIFYCNLVRSEPLLFLNTYLEKYIDSTGVKTSYTKSLVKTLKTLKAPGVLVPSEKLSGLAKTHAIDFGKNGKVGHGNFKKRFKKYYADCNCDIGENCDYGNDRALNIVMSLLIDEKISSLGHRKNILNPRFKTIGVSIAEHKKYNWSCVMDFSSEPETD